MTGRRATLARPFEVSVQPRVCDCAGPVRVLTTKATLDDAIAAVESYWSLYAAFFEDETSWLVFVVADVRDGRVLWSNGVTTDGGSNGENRFLV